MDKYVTRTVSTESLSSSGSKRPAEDETDVWQVPKRPAPARLNKPTGSQRIQVSNRFHSLSTDHGGGQSSTTQGTASTKPKTSKIPPIVIEIQTDWTHVTIKTMISEYTKNFHFVYRGKNKVAVHCYNPEAHQKLKEGLKSKMVSFHTYSRKDEKQSKVVIRGLPASVEELIPDELASLGFKDIKVTKLRTKSPDAPFPPFLVQLQPGSDIAKFRQIKYLCHCVIDIQRYKPNSSQGTQCYRCQRFGHASKYCNLMARCVKCTEQHATKDCPKTTRDLPAQCCNCNEQHPANYSKCKEREKYLLRTQSNKKPLPRQFITGTETRKITHGLILEDLEQKVKKDQIEKPIMKEDLHSQFYDDTTIEMLQILNVIKNIKDEFHSCNSMVDKVILVLTKLGKYV